MLIKLSSFLSRYRGLPIMIAIALVALNFVLRFFNLGWIGDSNLFLHLGVVVGFVGILLAEALG